VGLTPDPSPEERGVVSCAIEVSDERDNIAQIILVFIIVPFFVIIK
jgi:hypothetical protein